MADVLEDAHCWECVTCGHEWNCEAEPAAVLIVKDAHDGPGRWRLHYFDQGFEIEGVVAGPQGRYQGEGNLLGGG